MSPACSADDTSQDAPQGLKAMALLTVHHLPMFSLPIFPHILKSCEYLVYRKMWVPMEPPCRGQTIRSSQNQVCAFRGGSPSSLGRPLPCTHMGTLCVDSSCVLWARWALLGVVSVSCPHGCQSRKLCPRRNALIHTHPLSTLWRDARASVPPGLCVTSRPDRGLLALRA